MNNYKLVLAYDGSRYNGFQAQKNSENTIQQAIELRLNEIFSKDIKIVASGRTDAGVHAENQVINFKIDEEIDLSSFLALINKKLPGSISVKEINKMPEDFHARFDAKSKIYEYRILNAPYPNPFLRKYAYFYPETLDIKEMEKASRLFTGIHDFRAFSSGSGKKSTTREIYSIKIERDKDLVKIIYHGNGFLYNMVRIITGTLIQISEKTLSEEDILRAFQRNERGIAGFTAPPQGLFLQEVIYSKMI
ncbi:tRNA pseudouridine(38-40) synthase TruA [Anaeropeptidivorans aminofermentans]|jgi:tRNA pseudouridine38-40 synthase|uniref:tRNA pseudouridine(38-40) synthase TruA n=1 Tax=Anaeropeptidivorans aminofermentans TaxID=2934315 RepID=UPI0020246C6B|nr:tRNA pseudouridine(38-40) synthase TruA [Anaeropeptidivorans aminofermentans]